jgi:hypothetical protein
MMDKEQGLFRKKPVVIEAVRTRFAIQAAKADWSALPEWLRLAYEKGPRRHRLRSRSRVDHGAGRCHARRA